MKELIAHIENLLLSNDCVIVPNFGGFVTYRLPAKWVEEQNSFLPPVRTVGFNPRLQLNDGLLVQSYMSFYGTSFPDANKRVMRGVKALKEKLYSDGKIDFASMGMLRLSLDGSFHFTPYIDGINSPDYYGLAELHLLPLKFDEEPLAAPAPAEVRKEEAQPVHPAEPTLAPRYEQTKRVAAEALRWVSATAAAVLLFVLFSTPVKNVLPESSYKAQILSSRFFLPAHAEQPEPVVQLPKKDSVQATPKKAVPATVETTTPAYQAKLAAKAPAAKPQEAMRPRSRFFIVVASLSKTEKAEAFCAELKQKGYSHACVVPGKTTQKVCIDAASDEDEALNLLRKYRETYGDAWMLTQAPRDKK